MRWVKDLHVNQMENRTTISNGIKNLALLFLILGFGMFMASMAKSDSDIEQYLATPHAKLISL